MSTSISFPPSHIMAGETVEPPHKKFSLSNKTLEWMKILFAFSWGWGLEILFHSPTPDEKPNEILVDDLDSAAPSW